MRIAVIAAVLLAGAAPALAYQTVQSALAAPARAKDAAEDSRRKPADIVALAQLKPGQTVADLLPGGGYWTRIFSGVVGPKGHVMPSWIATQVEAGKPGEARMKTLAAEPLGNTMTATFDPTNFKLPHPVDVVFTSQNVHDFINPGYGGVNLTTWGRQVAAALKPGGRLVIVDHAAAPGSGLRDTNTLHRIDPAVVRSSIEAAGFRFAGESKALANPQDDHTLRVFDPALRGHTDQFAYAFVKR